jgi:eukaryotic-like serine/threonine-protein kinase
MSASRSPRSLRQVLILVACLSVSLAACSSTSTSSTSASDTVGPTATATATPLPTATSVPPTATPNPNPYGGTLVFADPMTGSNEGHWDELSDPGQAICHMDSTGYHVTIYPNFGVNCYSRLQSFGDFAFQVQMTFVKGTTTDHGGIVFRTNGQQGANGYDYYMRADGRYTLARCQPSDCSVVLTSGTTSRFRSGLHVTNTIAVVAHGSTLSIYANGHLLQTVIDSGFTSGILGVQNTPNNGNTQSEVVYTDTRAWTL